MEQKVALTRRPLREALIYYGEKMTDERYKKIMADLGMPNSQSLLVALQQVANEAGQECAAAEREACAKECEVEASLWKKEQDVMDFRLCAARIRARSNAEVKHNAQVTGASPALMAKRPVD